MTGCIRLALQGGGGGLLQRAPLLISLVDLLNPWLPPVAPLGGWWRVRDRSRFALVLVLLRVVSAIVKFPLVRSGSMTR